MLAEHDLCCGCSACAAACKHGAIEMQYDELRFLYPTVNKNKCISCGLCTLKCPVLNSAHSVSLQKECIAYYGHYADETKIQQSSSGGFVNALAETVISQGGVVFGVCYDQKFQRAEYKKAETINELSAMRGSKYIMSEIDVDIYRDIEHELQNGRRVLFTGCPCEVGAIKRFLKRDYDNLVTCDLICQGGTTPISLRQYLDDMERKMGSKIVGVNMRAKKDGLWIPYCMNLRYDDGHNYITPLGTTDFDASFQHIKRKSCYQCSFKFPNCSADFTAGDHIGINEDDKGYNSSGVSIIFVHTQKGSDYVRQMNNFCFYPETYDKASGIQACLTKSIGKSAYYDDFRRVLLSDGLAKAAQFVHQEKNNTFQKKVKQVADKRLSNVIFDCVIWGVGKYFEITYETILKIIPNARIVGIVDKYKTGERHGIKIIKAKQLESVNFDHVFITTVNGCKEAVEKLQSIFGDDVDSYYTLAMLPGDETQH